MQIVIDIDERRFRDIQRLSTVQLKGRTPTLEQVIANGTPLPKGHGNLVDYEELKNNAREYGAYTEATLSHIKPKIIIEADKEQEDG